MSIETQAFSAYTNLLHNFLQSRTVIVASIDNVLNCQKKPPEYQQNASLQAKLFSDCFLSLPTIAAEQSAVLAELETLRAQDGLKPRNNPGNDIVDPVQMLLRAFHMWQQTRWPGQKGRVRYAHTLFNLFLIRQLTLLTLRLWDADLSNAPLRLTELQAVLDKLWQGSPNDQPKLVADVRWLIPVALSPTTDDLSGYFKLAALIADTLPETDKVEIQKAWVQTGAGHLCSQLRHLCVQQEVSIDDHGLVLLTRKSNALDVCLLMEGLVTLFKAYEKAWQSGEEEQRLSLAAVICHGVSPDPELYLLRLDLLGPYTMIEYLFIAEGSDGVIEYTPAGLRHLELFKEYCELLKRLSRQLFDDSQTCRPVEGGYSPYGALFGFSSNLLELMAFKTLQFEPVSPFNIQDVFTKGAADKRQWVNEWRKLPHVAPEVTGQFEYPESFAHGLHARIEQALKQCSSSTKPSVKCGKLYILSDESSQLDSMVDIPELAVNYIVASDTQLVEANKATEQSEGDLLHCRLEGEFLVSFKTSNGWMAISKDMLTEVLGKGQDIKILGLATDPARVLSLMCAGIVDTSSASSNAS